MGVRISMPWKGRKYSGRGDDWQMNYKEALDYMQQIGQYGISPGLDSIRQLVGRLGNPQKGMRYVHVAGTNGKGSVCAYVSSVLQRGGYRVGKYTSPACLLYTSPSPRD